MAKLIGWTLAFFVACVLGIFATVFKGYVTSKLWLWFVVPFGAPVIGTYVFAGLLTLFGLWRYKHKPKDDEQKGTKEFVSMITWQFMHPAVSLLFGYVLKGWV
jgi:hypothetical protein